MARLCPNSIWNISKLMVVWTNNTPYNSRLNDYCKPMIRLVSQAHLCSSSKKVTNNDEDIEPSFAPLKLMTSSLALLSNIIQRRKIRLKFWHACSIVHTPRLASLISSLFVARHEMSCSFVKTVFPVAFVIIFNETGI